MKQDDKTLKSLKKKVGERFRNFRLDKKKAQNVLAAELEVHQSTVTNIEHGATFPKVNYLYYFYEKYGLNLNWLVAGEGGKYIESWDYKGSSKIRASLPKYDSRGYDKYQELKTLMKIPVIEQAMFAKLTECKILFKDYVTKFYKDLDKEKREKQKKASQAKVRK